MSIRGETRGGYKPLGKRPCIDEIHNCHGLLALRRPARIAAMLGPIEAGLDKVIIQTNSLFLLDQAGGLMTDSLKLALFDRVLLDTVGQHSRIHSRTNDFSNLSMLHSSRKPLLRFPLIHPRRLPNAYRCRSSRHSRRDSNLGSRESVIMQYYAHLPRTAVWMRLRRAVKDRAIHSSFSALPSPRQIAALGRRKAAMPGLP